MASIKIYSIDGTISKSVTITTKPDVGDLIKDGNDYYEVKSKVHTSSIMEFVVNKWDKIEKYGTY